MNHQTKFAAACLVCLAALSSSAELQLAQDGATSYSIVRPAQPAKLDEYAVNALTSFLLEKTGTIFPVVPPSRVAPAGRHISVGLSEPALKVIGTDPLAALADQEYVVRSVDEDIFLYGKGMHGSLHAVVDFMENTLGRRWYSGRLITESPQWHNTVGKPTFTVERDSAAEPFSREGGFSFTYRLPIYEWMFDFHLQSGMNMFARRRVDPNASSLKVMPVRCHTVFGYIPPSPQEQPRAHNGTIWPRRIPSTWAITCVICCHWAVSFVPILCHMCGVYGLPLGCLRAVSYPSLSSPVPLAQMENRCRASAV